MWRAYIRQKTATIIRTYNNRADEDNCIALLFVVDTCQSYMACDKRADDPCRDVRTVIIFSDDLVISIDG